MLVVFTADVNSAKFCLFFSVRRKKETFFFLFIFAPHLRIYPLIPDREKGGEKKREKERQRGRERERNTDVRETSIIASRMCHTWGLNLQLTQVP